MRIRSLAIVATSALLTLTAVGTASADVVCRSTRRTEIGPFGAASQSARVCSNVGGLGFGGGLGGGGLGLGGGGLGFGGFGHHGGGIHINIRL